MEHFSTTLPFYVIEKSLTLSFIQCQLSHEFISILSFPFSFSFLGIIIPPANNGNCIYFSINPASNYCCFIMLSCPWEKQNKK